MINIATLLVINGYFILAYFETLHTKEEKKLKFADINKEYGYQNYEDDDEGKHQLILSYTE